VVADAAVTDPTALDRAFAVEAFQDHLTLEAGNSRHTVDSYARDIRRLAGFVSARGRRDPGAVEPRDLREFVYHLKDLGLAATSIRRQISAVRTYYRFLIAEGSVAADPSENLELPKQWRTLPDVLTGKEIERLLGAPNTDQPMAWRDRALLEVAYGTGARVSELVGLTVHDLHFDEALVRLVGKGGKERIVPIGRSALGATALYVREIRPRLDRGQTADHLFLNARGRPLTRVGMWGIVRKHAEAAGLRKRVTPHTLRHTFATHLLEGGADLRAVQAMLFFNDTATTEIYTHVDRDYLRSVHQAFHPRS
jgi:integrase/recombinase XerD